MSFKTARGTILLTNGFEDPSSPDLPDIISFTVGGMDPLTNKFYVYFSVVKNYATLQLVCKFLDDNNNEVQELRTIIDVFGLESFMFYRNKNYKTSIELIAINKNGQDSEKLEPIDKANNNLNVFDSEIISDFSITNTTGTYNQVDTSFYLNQIAGFNILDVEEIKLYYKRQDYIAWKTILLQNIYVPKEDASRIVVSYFYDLKKIKIERQAEGGYFDFKIEVRVKNFEGQASTTLRLFFDNITASQTKKEDSKFPKAELIDAENPASLRYEISTRIAQGYFLANGEIYNDPLNVPFSSYYLNNEDSYKSSSDLASLILVKDSKNYFYYNYQQEIGLSGTKGFFFPASISEILPCILINELPDQNQSIILFWKINDNFFDYSFLNKNISVFTSYVKVKVQYKVNGVYNDLTNEIQLTKEANFDSIEQKFILFLRRDIDILEAKRAFFDAIGDNDNKTDNLRILVVEHKVDCSSFREPTRTFVFDKLMVPPDWRYIAYDKYIPLDSSLRNPETEKITLNLNGLYLRGIRLPDKGFKKFDHLESLSSIDAGEFGLRIFYKLACEFSAFYQDPVLEGTVNAVELPSIPSDIFLTPPDLVLPPPNYLKIENGGIQAEGIVVLDDYGKINGIQVTDPGQGYSFYTTALSKRQQTFTDLIPYVKTSYLVVGTNQNNNPSALTVQNNSFDKTALLASIRGGVRLASVNNDRALLNNSNDSLSSLQDQKIDQYFQRQTPDNSYIEDNSSEPYQVVTPVVEQMSIGILDEEWNIITQLYSNRNINPYDQGVIYSEDVDTATAEITDSSLNPDIKVSNEITPISINPEAQQTSASGGSWQMFELSDLKVIPDGSPAVSLTNSKAAPPYMTLLPTSVRSDQAYGFGPLPNMLPRAEMFNRFAIAVNSLNSVRLIAPFVWKIDTTTDLQSYYGSLQGINPYDIVSFDTYGYRNVEPPIISTDLKPINTLLSVKAFRSVGKINLAIGKLRELDLLIAPGNYKLSQEASGSVNFTAKIHPLMTSSIPPILLKNLSRKYLGIVTETTESCGSLKLPVDQNGRPYFMCSYDNSGNSSEYSLPSSIRQIPWTKTTSEIKFEFFGENNSLSLTANGSAQAFELFVGKGDKTCGGACGDSSAKVVDFTYTNMFPAIIQL